MTNPERIQEASVELLMNKFDDEPSHSRQVTKLALLIFNLTKDSLHVYGKKEKNYLKYASLLHDIGYAISAEKHNKNSYKLIIESKMDGFTYDDLEIIANIARYHRGGLPSKKHENFEAIKDKKDREMVKVLSSFLRIADGLDRSHTDAIKDIKILVDKDIARCLFILFSRSIICTMELEGARKKKDLFEEHFGLIVDFQFKHA